MSKFLIFLAISMAIVSLSSAWMSRLNLVGDDRVNIGRSCTYNGDCNGRKICNTHYNRCVDCIEDSDCRRGQFCVLYMCRDTLPLEAACVEDSWCTSETCSDNKCADRKENDGQLRSTDGQRF